MVIRRRNIRYNCFPWLISDSHREGQRMETILPGLKGVGIDIVEALRFGVGGGRMDRGTGPQA